MFCVDYQILNNLLPLAVAVHLKVQGALSLVQLPMIEKLYTMVNGSTVYSSLNCTSGYQHVALLPEAQKKSASVPLIGKCKFKRILLSLAHATTHFGQIIDELIRDLTFTCGYLDDILLFSESTDKYIEHPRDAFDRLGMASLQINRKRCNCFLKLNFII